MAKKRKATTCEACGFPSWDGRVCKSCKRFYGTAEDAIAGAELQRRLKKATFDEVWKILGEMVDSIVPDWNPFPAARPDRHHTVSRQDRDD
jgi:hypothetical protein